MQASSFSSSKRELLDLSKKECNSPQQAQNTAKTLIDLIEKFPDLKKDAESAKSLSDITEKLFTFKETLSIPQMIDLFWSTHHDDKTAVNLLNTAQRNSKTDLTLSNIESYISKRVKEGHVDYFKQHLTVPIRLSFFGSHVTDEDLLALEGFPIRELDLRNCQNLTKTAFEHLPEVKSLSLGGNKWVDGDALSKIPSYVKELDLSGSHQLKDEDFLKLPTHFTSLNVSFCEGVSGKALGHIAKMDRLEDLNLAEIKDLEKHLQSIPKTIISLNVTGCGITDKTLESFSPLTRLTKVYLGGSLITDNGLQFLPESIRWLSLNNCHHLTNKGAQDLAKREQLKTVFLRRCPKVTEEGLKDFNSSVEVGWDESQPSRLARNLKF